MTGSILQSVQFLLEPNRNFSPRVELLDRHVALVLIEQSIVHCAQSRIALFINHGIRQNLHVLWLLAFLILHWCPLARISSNLN